MTFWTDSSTCLYWLHTKEILSAYVANRVCFILDNTQPTQWKHVNTDQNPADVPTRGSPVSALVDNELWWSGPTFLKQHHVLFGENNHLASPLMIHYPNSLLLKRRLEDILSQLKDYPILMDVYAWLLILLTVSLLLRLGI